MRRPVLLLVFLGALTLALPATAPAAQRTITKRFGPVGIGPYAVKYRTSRFPSPRVDGHIVRMHARLVGRDGRPLPIGRMMLHHLTFKDLGRPGHTRRDVTYCKGSLGERFYGTGEEDRELVFPQGYGYRIHRRDRWDANWMLMNHSAKSDRAWVEYTVTVDDDPAVADLRAFWVGVTNGCGVDPIFDVPGHGPPGSVHTESAGWTVPISGRIIVAGGHIHGGALDVGLQQPRCADRDLFVSHPLYGNEDHPYYHVLPNLHEPGPISSSLLTTPTGVPVEKGERLRITTHYDAQTMHVRAMGIMHVYIAPGRKPQDPCAALPADKTEVLQKDGGRLAPPAWTVPLTGIGPDGRATTIDRPPGRIRHYDAPRTITIDVTSPRFELNNLDVPAGTTVRWRFDDELKHDVTVADGPFGFSSQPLSAGRSYRRTLTQPGAYKLFCSLHPVAMTQRIDVR
ncbi:MAG TPA: plastocyanin/azurin family copper-binding protein [Solirubrobacteraceae bacterium]|jgi:plastocyanin